MVEAPHRHGEREAKAVTAEMAAIAEASLVEARAVARSARRALRRAGDGALGKALATLAELETLVSRLGQVVAQAHQRLSGETPEGAKRLVSLHDPDARPVKKGRIGKPVEFGYLGQVLDNGDGIVVDHSLHMGNRADVPLLAPAVARVKRLARRAPDNVTADRGYGDAKVDKDLTELGVSFVAIIRKGRQGAARRNLERSSRFRKLIKWRTGSEGRISALKRSWGWSKSLMDGLDVFSSPGSVSSCPLRRQTVLVGHRSASVVGTSGKEVSRSATSRWSCGLRAA